MQSNAPASILAESNSGKEVKMKIHLFQELLALNEEFGHVIHGLSAWNRNPLTRGR